MVVPEKIDFVGLGPPKCGTTWIENQLSRHPDIFMTRECRLWVPGEGLVRSRLRSGRAFASYGGERHVGTYHNLYVSSPAILSHLRSDLPEGKFFTSLRDPLDRTVSAVRHSIKRGRARPGTSFEEMMKDDYLRHYCVDMSMYDDLLARCCAYLDRRRLKVLVFEDIAERPRELLDELVGFLGADRGLMPDAGRQALAERVNRGFTPRWPLVERTGRRIRRLGRRWRNSPGGPAAKGAAALADRAARQLERLNRVYEPRDVIAPETQRSLALLYLPGVRRAEELSGRDLSSTWSRTCALAV